MDQTFASRHIKNSCLRIITLILFIPLSVWAKTAVFILSLDGVSVDELKKFDPQFLKSANVQEIRPPDYSMTIVSHVAMATGENPEVNGVTTNNKRIRADDLKVKPIWTEASEQGVEVHALHWAGSNGPWHGIDHHRDKNYRPFENETFTDTVGYGLDSLKKWDRKSDFFFMAYTPGLDNVGHLTGPYSSSTRAAWGNLKKDIQKFEADVSKILKPEDKLVVLYVADHGMVPQRSPTGTVGVHGDNPSTNHELLGAVWSIDKNTKAPPLPKKATEVKKFIEQALNLSAPTPSEAPADAP